MTSPSPGSSGPGNIRLNGTKHYIVQDSILLCLGYPVVNTISGTVDPGSMDLLRAIYHGGDLYFLLFSSFLLESPVLVILSFVVGLNNEKRMQESPALS